MELVENTKLSMIQIAQLTGIVLGVAQPRSADKAKAIAKLYSAMHERIGDGSVTIIANAISCDDCDDALKLIKDELLKHDRKNALPTTRLENTVINGGSTPAATEPKQKAKDKMKDETQEATSNRGRKSDLLGKTLTCTKEENPRREGSHGYKSIQIIIDNPGITTEAFIEAGGRLVDLKWDIKNNSVTAA